MNKEEKYKNKIMSIIEQKGLYSIMNYTKWNELKIGIYSLPFPPPYIMKRVDGDSPSIDEFNTDVWYLGDWGLNILGYISSDIYATPFYAIEWIMVRPRYTKHQGRLMPDLLIDETEEFIEILKKYNIPYEEAHSGFIIYGYR